MTAISQVALPISAVRAADLDGNSGFAFVGISGKRDADGHIRCYSIDGGRWTQVQEVASASPVAIVMHPDGRMLYVLNEVSTYKGLPRGSVEAFRLNAASGKLEPLGREPLSLSATMPRSMAVAPDGRTLVVAVHGGGLYNLRPLLPDGRLGCVTGILKETGCGPVAVEQESAHPQKIVFDATGERFVSVDYGSDRVSLFSVRDGIERLASFHTSAGSGPSELALHPSGQFIFVGHALDGSISTLGYEGGNQKLKELAVNKDAGFGASMVMDADGLSLYSAAGSVIRVWKIDLQNGTLHQVQSQLAGSVDQRQRVRAMDLLPSGKQLLALTDSSVSILDVEPGTGRLGKPRLVLEVSGARCFALG